MSLLLKKMALFPEEAWSLPARADLSFWLRIVKLLAMFLLTVLILASFVAEPEEAFEFLSVLSSSFNFSILALIASLSDSLILWQTFFSTIPANINIILKYSK